MRPLSLLFLFSSVALAGPQGFKTTKFAEPPDVEYPTALSAAADGTVYVSVDKNGSLGKAEKMGKVVLCRDTDDDGKADEFVDFIPKIDSPRGSHFVGDRLYIIHPPFLSSYRDTTGDGKADEHKVLLENIGFGMTHPRGSDHTTNGCRMGIDGWLYIAVGDFGMEGTKGTDGRVVTMRGGGVARVRPDGTQLEVYSSYTRNICDVAISPYLDLFTRDNTNDGKGWNIRLHHFTNGSDHGYPRLYKSFADEAVKPLLDLGGGSGTGSLYLHEPGLPRELGDALFTCDWTTGKIYQHDLKAFEATFVAEQDDFIKLDRAIDIDVDGESRLYICDWRNGGYNYGGDGKKVGMIQRMTPKDGNIEAWPDLTKEDAAALVGQLVHRSAVRRLEAQQELVKRETKPEMAKELFALIKDAAKPLYGRVAAIFAFKQIYGKTANQPLAELVTDASIREYVLRAMTDRKDQLEETPVTLYREALQDSDPRVRLQAVIGLERLGALDAAEDLLVMGAKAWQEREKLEEEEDLRVPFTCIRALASMGAAEACLAAVTVPAKRPIALRALQLMHKDSVVDGLAVIESKSGANQELRADVMGVLARLYHEEAEWDKKAWWGTRPDDRGPYFALAEWSGTEKVKTALEQGFARLPKAQHSDMFEILALNRVDISKLNFGAQNPLQLALNSPAFDKGQLILITNGALDRNKPWEQRLACYRALARGEAGQVLRYRAGILSRWIREPKVADHAESEVTDFINEPSLVLHLKGLRDIARKEDDRMSRIAWRAILGVSQSPLTEQKYKDEALAMAKDDVREVGFFHALTDLGIPGFEDQIVAAKQSDNTKLIRAAEHAEETTAKKSTGEKKVSELDLTELAAAAMVEKGTPERGKELFTRQGCLACHTIDQGAMQKGPYLGSAGNKFTRDYLIEAILDPNAVVAQGFQTELITMKDGRVQMGFVTNEQDGVIELRNIGGLVSQLKESEVESRKLQTNSMMPEGLTNTLTRSQFLDLLEYVASMKE